MPLDLADYEREAVKVFWGNRSAAVQKQKELGRADQGERAGVTGGKTWMGFLPSCLPFPKAGRGEAL